MTDITQRLAESFATIDRLRAMSHDPCLPWPVSRGLEITDALIAHFNEARALYNARFAAMPAAPVLRVPIKVAMPGICPDLFTQTFIERRPHPVFIEDASIQPHNRYRYRVVGIPALGTSEMFDENRSIPHTQFEGYEYPDIISAICSWRVSILSGNPLGFYNMRVDYSKKIHSATKRIRAMLAPSNIHITPIQNIGEYKGRLISELLGCIHNIRDLMSHKVAACAMWPYPYPFLGVLNNFDEVAAFLLLGLDWRPLYAAMCACRVKLHAAPPTSLGEFLRPFWDIGIHELSFFDVHLPGEPKHLSLTDAITHAVMQGSRADDFWDQIDAAVYRHMVVPEIGQPTPPLIFRLDADILAAGQFVESLEAQQKVAAIEAEMAAMRD